MNENDRLLIKMNDDLTVIHEDECVCVCVWQIKWIKKSYEFEISSNWYDEDEEFNVGFDL